jgi:two-component system LytT family response regulator
MTRALRLLLVDDEPLARRRLRRLLATEPDIDIAGECGTGAEAIDLIGRASPDLVLLDVQMPEGDGFEVVERLGPAALPLVVFVTAYDEFALRAFEAAALDYLVKPVRRARLRTALGRARERLALHAAASATGSGGGLIDLAGVAAASGPPAAPRPQPEGDGPRSDRLLIDRGRHLDVVRVDDIDWVEAADNNVIVHVGEERHRFRRTMEEVLERLPPDRFVRVHRSTIVNLNRVRQVHAWFHGNYLLVLDGGTKLTTGRQFRDQLMRRLDLLR